VAGPFRVVRNPIFSFMVVAVGGLGLLVPNLAALFAVVALVIALELHVRFVEEPHLLRTHGEAYKSYAHRTGRFIPRIGRDLGHARRD
jgi:protein-S-isoprenylcysteine O-methyltransferase Ste14